MCVIKRTHKIRSSLTTHFDKQSLLKPAVQEEPMSKGCRNTVVTTFPARGRYELSISPVDGMSLRMSLTSVSSVSEACAPLIPKD